MARTRPMDYSWITDTVVKWIAEDPQSPPRDYINNSDADGGADASQFLQEQIRLLHHESGWTALPSSSHGNNMQSDQTVHVEPDLAPASPPLSLYHDRLSQAVWDIGRLCADVLVQVWVPVVSRTSQKWILTTRCQPYFVDPNLSRLQMFRTATEGYECRAQADDDSAPLDLPSRVFAYRTVDWSPDVQMDNSLEYSRREEAQRWGVRGSLSVPILDPATRLCVAVLELVGHSDQSHDVNLVSQALQHVNLASVNSGSETTEYPSEVRNCQSLEDETNVDEQLEGEPEDCGDSGVEDLNDDPGLEEGTISTDHNLVEPERPEVVPVVPARPGRGRRKIPEFSHCELETHFDVPLRDVSKRLGVCTTSMKKICREAGIGRWPCRTVRSLSKKLQLTGAESVMEELKKMKEYQELKESKKFKELERAQEVVTTITPPPQDNMTEFVPRSNMEVPKGKGKEKIGGDNMMESVPRGNMEVPKGKGKEKIG